MKKQEQLSMAIKISSNAHENQFDKSGKAYILHPLHLMQQLLFDTELATIAVLHDVIEDSLYTISMFKQIGFSERVINAVSLLTHKSEDSYDDYIDKICQNYDALRVKRKDIQHNSDVTRLKGIRDKDHDRIKKYHRAFLKLGKAKDNFKENNNAQ